MIHLRKVTLVSLLFGLFLVMTLLLVSGVPDLAPPSAAAADGNLLVNPGFEDDGVGTGDPTGWLSIGDTYADYTESGGHSGDYRLAHWNAGSYQVATSQTVTGLDNGPHILRVWVKSGGGQNEAYIALRNCGSAEVQVPVTQTSNIVWEQLEATIDVTNGECTVVLFSDANAGNWANFDDAEFLDASMLPEPTPTPKPVTLGQKGKPLAIRGADVSSLDKSEVMGGIYRYPNGKPGDALEILSKHGMNYIRLRVWVDPDDGYHTKERILPMAKRANDLGMGVLIDFHYSDFWADPGRQDKPAAWADYDLEQLETAVYEHTADVCNALVAQGTPPDMVQIGNEINGGMLWPEGALATYNWQSFTELAGLLKQGVQAVNDCSPETKIMLHLAEAGNFGLQDWWYGKIIAEGVPFDVMGLSYYPYWHGTLETLQDTLNSIVTLYDKDIVIVEFAYPFTLANDDHLENIVIDESQLTPGYAATPSGQRVMTRKIMNIVSEIPNDHGLGVFYWDATWTAVDGNGWDPTNPSSGNGWENQALFDFDDQALPALLEFQGKRSHAAFP